MSVTVDHDVPVPMRDGVVLRANVYRPAAPGRYPALVLRTPYGKNHFQFTHLNLDPVRAAEAGYVVVLQDTRGRFSSDGDRFEPYLDDFADGYDTVEWAAALPYSNGRTGVYGVSYSGGMAWWAAASDPPSLQAIAPTQAPSDLFVNLVWRGGAFLLGQHLFWSLGMVGPSELRRKHRGDPELAGLVEDLVDELDRFEELANTLPPKALPIGEPDDPFLPYLYDVMTHAERDGYYAERSMLGRHHSVTVPALIVAGWYDVLLGNDLDHYGAVRASGGSNTAREQTRLVIGPWSHGPGLQFPAVGQLNFGARSAGMSLDLKDDLTSLHLRWFDRWLKDVDDDDQPAVKLFVMGANRWRDEDRWPLARATPEQWFLTSEGRLGQSPPSPRVPPLEYIYDPKYPCPTLGGNLLMPLSYQRGPVDQTALLGRDDVLTFSTEPLDRELEVTGPVVAVLYAATSATDTDWVVKLCDVHADGRTFNVCDGIVRARFRETDWRKPSLVRPDAIERYDVDLWATSMVFKAGHRIRVLVTSSDFPRYDRNPNTGDLGVDAILTVPSRQRIYCTAEHPSHIMLPVIR